MGKKWKYAVVLDAGSSGTRAHIYRWPKKPRKGANDAELKRLPQIETTKEWTKKIKPGLSSFRETPKKVGPDHLHSLLEHINSIISEDDVEDTPLFLLATAGMRLLSDHEQKEILNSVCSYIRDNSEFLLPDCDTHVKVIDGKTEGLYGWIATNYLVGGFDEPKSHDHGKGHHTYGFLDMGGASAQLAFAPNSTEAEKHANDLTLLRLRNLNGQSIDYAVFVTSWLGFGVRQARSRYVKALLSGTPPDTSNRQRIDPCLPNGLRTALDGNVLPPDGPVAGTDPYLVGNGKFEDCLRETIPLLAKDVPCEDEPCLLNGVHVPAIDFDVNHFVGISEYWHTTHEIFEMGHQDKAYDFGTYQKRVKEFCSTPWSLIKEDIEHRKWGKVDEETAYEVCFKASWVINVLHDGIGIPRIGLESGSNSSDTVTEELAEHDKHWKQKAYLSPFQAVNKINSTEVSWTLGKAVLYASSRVKPAEKGGLPVGFGSNVPGKVPDDFEYPSVDRQKPKDDDHWHGSLFDGDSPRRIPGLVLFGVIVLIAIFFLLGRERRSRVFYKLGRRCGRGGNGGGNLRKKFPFLKGGLPFLFRRGTGASYERVLEEGDHQDFELGSMDSVENSQSSSPSMSPTLGATGSRPVSRGHQLQSPKLIFDNASSLSIASNNNNNSMMDRHGLVIRTESRERLFPPALAPTTTGRKSRAASPTRLSAPLTNP